MQHMPVLERKALMNNCLHMHDNQTTEARHLLRLSFAEGSLTLF